jgi:ketosteroid isomerase-like protein
LCGGYRDFIDPRDPACNAPLQSAPLHGKQHSRGEILRGRCHGENLFIRWVARATRANGRPIEHSGVDRIRVVDGKVVENRIFFDRAAFERRLGKSLKL